MTKEEVLKKLDEIDKTFTNKTFNDHLGSYKDIIPLKKYKLDSNPDSLSTLIKNMHKIKPYIKNNGEILAQPISLIVRMIETADYFPEICNTSKYTFIGKPPKDRGIFSLTPIPKILESVIKNAFDELKDEDGTFQTAYT